MLQRAPACCSVFDSEYKYTFFGAFFPLFSVHTSLLSVRHLSCVHTERMLIAMIHTYVTVRVCGYTHVLYLHLFCLYIHLFCLYTERMLIAMIYTYVSVRVCGCTHVLYLHLFCLYTHFFCLHTATMLTEMLYTYVSVCVCGCIEMWVCGSVNEGAYFQKN